MNRTQYGSLTGTPRYQYFPQESRVTNITNYSPLDSNYVDEFLRVHDEIDSAYIASLIKGVTNQVESYCGLATTPRTIESYWQYPKQLISIPVKPVSAITAVTKVNHDGTESALVLGTDYTVTGMNVKYIHLKVDCYALRVTYEAGYQTNSCPDAVQDAIVQEISLQYKNRQDSNQPSRTSVNSLSIEARHLLIGGGFYDHSR
jgi:hypothetical protein